MSRRYSHAARRARPATRRRGVRIALDILLAGALVAVLAFVVARFPESEYRQVGGSAVVSDGDSLRVGEVRIRLAGIDAPELEQICVRAGEPYPCGREAREALVRLLDGAPVSCESRHRDRYSRLLAHCTAGQVDLNRAMVEEGWAVAFGDFEDAERRAMAARRGLWSGTFDRPRDWRRMHGGLVEWEHGLMSRLGEWLAGVFGMANGPDIDQGEVK